MKAIFIFILVLFTLSSGAQIICGDNGNLIIYSNYDGGIVTINVDADIPDLKIGICTYEPVQVTITGPFVSNVTQVIYAGFASTQGNDNCGLGDFPTTITGVDPGIIDIEVAPDAGYDNPQGWPQIIGVVGECSSSINAGGANTPDQVVFYFLQATGGVFYAHYTQYSCWLNQTYNVSAGGNCCVVPETECIPPQVDAGSDLSICSGQEITIGGSPTASGGSSSNYTYSWFPENGLNNPESANPQASPEFTTTYTVTVTSGGDASCTASASVTVNVGEVQSLAVTVDGDLLLCPNESITLTAQSGFTNYLWSNNQTDASLTVTSPGTYSVTAAGSGGCAAVSDNFVVTASPPFQVDVTPAGPVSICGSEPVILSAEAGFTNYTWSNGQTGTSLSVTSSGLYSVSAQNASGCIGASPLVDVEISPVPVAGFTALQLDEYTVQFTNTSTGGGEYTWDFGFGILNNEANPEFDFPFDNDWPVSLIVSNACGSDTSFQLVTVIKTGINDLLPNPFSIFKTETGAMISGFIKRPETVQLKVYNLAGQVLQESAISLSGDFNIDVPLAVYSKGIYLIHLNTTSGSFNFKWLN
jgi:hypothetical protein